MYDTTGQNTDGAMTQKATTNMFRADYGATRIGNAIASSAFGSSIAISSYRYGNAAYAQGWNSIMIGGDSCWSKSEAVSIGHNAQAEDNAVAIGHAAYATKDGSIALGSFSSATAKGEMNIGSTDTTYGYNSSNYRLLSGLYDGQSAHDAVTVEQVNATIDAINTAFSTNIPHIGA